MTTIAPISAAQRNIDQFKAAHPEVAAWLKANRGSFDFARSLCQSVERWGQLTDNQLNAVHKMIDRAKIKGATSDLDISSLSGYYAVPNGATRLKLRVSHPGKDSRWHGHTFVSDGAAYGQRQNYGSQAPGENYRGRLQEELRTVLADPKAAQIAYGKLTGTCGVCGRLLEDAESIAAGIGPVCAGRYAPAEAEEYDGTLDYNERAAREVA